MRRADKIANGALGAFLFWMLIGIVGLLLMMNDAREIHAQQTIPFPAAQTAFVSLAEANIGGGTTALGGANAVDVAVLYLPYQVRFSNITVKVAVGDASNNYSWGIYTIGGSAICTTTAATQAATGLVKTACTQGTVSAGPGMVMFAETGAANTVTIATAGSTFLPFSTPASATTSTGGQLPGIIAPPTAGTSASTGFGQPFVFLN